MDCGGLWLCGYLPISRVLREQGQLLPHHSDPSSLLSFYGLLTDFSWAGSKSFCLNPPPLWVQEGPLPAAALVNPNPARRCCLLLATRGHCPASPSPAPPHAFTGGGVGLAPCAGSASSPRCLFTRPWNHSSLGTSHPPVWLAHVASICQGALVMQPQEKLPRGCDFLRRNLDDKFLKEKWNFIYGRQYCVRVRVLVHSPA